MKATVTVKRHMDGTLSLLVPEGVKFTQSDIKELSGALFQASEIPKGSDMSFTFTDIRSIAT